MNFIQPSDKPRSTPQSPAPGNGAPLLLKNFRLPVSVLLLTAAADFLVFGIPLGSGLALLCGCIWLGLRLNRPAGQVGWRECLLFALMATSAIQTMVEPSFSNGLVLFLLTIYASGHLLHRQLSPYWRRALEGLAGLLDITRTFTCLGQSMHDARNASCSANFRGASKQGRRWLATMMPAFFLALSFLILFAKGNAIMGDELQQAFETSWIWLLGVKLPSFVRIGFWASLCFALFALFRQSPLSPYLARIQNRLPRQWPPPADLAAAIWSTRLLLITVNGVFFAANSVDVFFLWMKTELPSDVSFSQYVHQGVYNLIACVVLAATVLLAVFQQDKQITTAKGQRWLAYLWIAQNFLLITSVLLRLKLYVDAYHLSLLRIYVAIFLVLVAIGFILLAIKIGQNRSFAWLVQTNLLTVFLLFFSVQFLNERAFVARYNYEKALTADRGDSRIDIGYLTSLGPPAWPVLRQIANDAAYFGNAAGIAGQYLHAASGEEQNRRDTGGWRSWQYRRWIASHSLPNYDSQASSVAHGASIGK